MPPSPQWRHFEEALFWGAILLLGVCGQTHSTACPGVNSSFVRNVFMFIVQSDNFGLKVNYFGLKVNYFGLKVRQVSADFGWGERYCWSNLVVFMPPKLFRSSIVKYNISSYERHSPSIMRTAQPFFSNLLLSPGVWKHLLQRSKVGNEMGYRK